MTRVRPLVEAPEVAATAPAETAAPPLTDAYRPIRRVAPPHAPLEGVLAAAGERRVVLADAAAVADRVFLGRSAPPQ
ncbi:hypothetical protein, partial [Microbacterium sp.]|uniref:hypothetical protein n=1 Tax=Microbacterium sp. TaxID=51671 RepID=UPI0028117BFD